MSREASDATMVHLILVNQPSNSLVSRILATMMRLLDHCIGMSSLMEMWHYGLDYF